MLSLVQQRSFVVYPEQCHFEVITCSKCGICTSCKAFSMHLWIKLVSCCAVMWHMTCKHFTMHGRKQCSWAGPAKLPHHIVVWEHVCNGQMATWRQQSLLETIEGLSESSVCKIRGSGCFEPVFRTSAVGAVQSVAIRQNFFLLGSQILHFTCLLRFQHLHGDHGEVPSPGVTARGGMLQLVYEDEMGCRYNRFDPALHDSALPKNTALRRL